MEKAAQGGSSGADGGGSNSNSSSRSSSRPTSAGSSPCSAGRGLPGRPAAGRLEGGGSSSSPGSAAVSPGGGGTGPALGSGCRREQTLEGALSKYTNLLQGWQSRKTGLGNLKKPQLQPVLDRKGSLLLRTGKLTPP